MEFKYPTYSIQVSDVTPAATATDILNLSGSNTKTIMIKELELTADATAASVLDFYVYKRTIANTGGTSTSPTIFKYDTDDLDPTSTVLLYSANPTLGGSGNTLVSATHYALPAAASTGYPGVPWTQRYGTDGDKYLLLKGANESIGIGCNGGTIPAGTIVYIKIVWTEA